VDKLKQDKEHPYPNFGYTDHHWTRWKLPFNPIVSYWGVIFGYEAYWIRWWFDPYTLYWIDTQGGHC
jgi:hypothetical protein